MSAAPWLALTADPEATFAWREGGAISRAQFCADVLSVAARLPPGSHFVNACAGRYRFAVVFVATWLAGRVSLLPPAAGAAAIADARAAFADARDLTDGFVNECLAQPRSPMAASSASALREPGAETAAAIAFTSGTTGRPQAHVKSWHALAMSAYYCCQQVGRGGRYHVVATVPQQHMYGLETTVMTAVVGGWPMFDGPAFYPAEVAAALAAIPRPRLLVTAPFHLRHLLNLTQALPAVDVVLSATAPLSRELAAEAEQRFGAEVQEIYGCTEAGSLATRRTVLGELWTPYPGVALEPQDDRTVVHAAHVSAAVSITDRLEVAADGRFVLLGRDADLVKVAGRRASIADITSKLANLNGVRDAIVFMPSDEEDARPAALVVAPARTAAELRQELAALIDPVFVPRPIRVIDSLPRNALGKLPKQALLELLGARND